jgi:hypothetical protein
MSKEFQQPTNGGIPLGTSGTEITESMILH